MTHKELIDRLEALGREWPKRGAVCAEAAARLRALSTLDDRQRGAMAYELTKRLVIDMPTARAVVESALKP